MIWNTHTTFGSGAKFFHWIIALLVVCMLIFGFFLGGVPKSYQALAYNNHKLVGITILVLMLSRSIWALMNPKPILPPGSPYWQEIAHRIVQGSLYVTVIAMPIFGWIGSTAAGKPPHIPGAGILQLPVSQSKALAEAAFSMHNLLAFVIIALLCVHVGAAFYHHFILKDNVLRRMLPRKFQKNMTA